MKIDIGDLCTHCGKDTSFGSGLKVNRIPSNADGRFVLYGANDVIIPMEISDVDLEGFMCVECQRVDCDQCGELVLNYEIIDSQVICEVCHERNIFTKEEGE